MQVLLNIGLQSKTLGKIAPVEALSAIRLNGMTVTRSTVVQSDTEPTLAAEVEMEDRYLANAVLRTSDDLGQDCIAVYDQVYGMGNLLGAKAWAWGPFNPEFFFLLDGTRLQAPVAKAA